MNTYFIWCGIIANVFASLCLTAIGVYFVFEWWVRYGKLYRDFAEFLRQKYWRSPLHDDPEAVVCDKCKGRGELFP